MANNDAAAEQQLINLRDKLDQLYKREDSIRP